jgi:hypothetical protein
VIHVHESYMSKSTIEQYRVHDICNFKERRLTCEPNVHSVPKVIQMKINSLMQDHAHCILNK